MFSATPATKYLTEQKDDRKKRNAVGVYQNSGLSQ